MTKHDIRWRRQEFSSKRIAKHKNYGQLLEQHRRAGRMRMMTYLLGLVALGFVVGTIYYAMGRIEKQIGGEQQKTTTQEQTIKAVDPMVDLENLEPKPARGITNYHNYLEGNLVYPEEALENGIEGHVYVEFVVEVDGSLSRLKVLRGLGSGCDEVAMELVANGPAWKPGTVERKPTAARMVVPIIFKLPNEADSVSATG